MAQKTVKKLKTPAKAKAPVKAKSPKATSRKVKAKKATKVANARFVCRDCNSSGKGGYFTAAGEKGAKCPHCSSTNVKLLG